VWQQIQSQVESFAHSLLLNAKVKELLKSDHIYQSCRTIIEVAYLYMGQHGVEILNLRVRNSSDRVVRPGLAGRRAHAQVQSSSNAA